MQKMGIFSSLFIILYLYSTSTYFKVWIFFSFRNKAQDILSIDVFIFLTICSSPLTTLAILTASSSLSNPVLNQRE